MAESKRLEIEQALIAQCDIPVFSDEPHGMAIVVVASLLTALNEAMKIAAIRALHLLALQPVPLDVLRTYNVDRLVRGKDYIVPKPLDGRLHSVVAGAVARAAIDSGEARISFPAHYSSIYPFFYPFLVDVPSPLFDHGQSSCR